MQEKNKEVIIKLLNQIKGNNPYIALSNSSECRGRSIHSDINAIDIDSAWFYCIAGLKENNGHATRAEAGTNNILALDIDDAEIRKPELLENRLAKLKEKLDAIKNSGRFISPTLWINSGGGFHLIWFLKESISGEKAHDLIMRGIDAFKSDTQCKDASTRLLRLPNHINDKPDKGYSRETSVVHFDPRKMYDPELFESKWPKTETQSEIMKDLKIDSLGGLLTEGSRNPALYKKAQEFARKKIPMQQTFETLSPFSEQAGLTPIEIETTIRSAYRSRIVDGSDELGMEYQKKFKNEMWKTQNAWTINAVDCMLEKMKELRLELGNVKNSNAVQEIKDMEYIPSDRLDMGFKTLYEDFPLYKKRTYVLTAAAKTGKSTTLALISNKMAEKHKVVYFTNEMSFDEMAVKIACNEASLNLYEVERGRYDKQKLEYAIKNINTNIKLIHLDTNANDKTIRDHISRLSKIGFDADFVVIDSYERLKTEDGFRMEATLFQKIMDIAREYNFCLFAVVNQNRKGQEKASADKIGHSFEPVKLADCTIVSELRLNSREIIWNFEKTRFTISPDKIFDKVVFSLSPELNKINDVTSRFEMEEE